MKTAEKNVEIERKWKLLKLPPEIEHSDFKEVPCVKLEQAYLVSDPETEFRLRREGPKYFATRKRGNGLVREEKQKEIKRESYLDLIAGMTEGRVVEKWRFRYKLNGHVLEFDQFEGHLQDLVLLEVEFKSEEDAANFSLPEWVVGAEEVTGDPQYQNKNLALQD
ncbi:MAG: adenylate cyclase [Candidatus Pacebacteria bacterium]|nr:adenylate cyclase [Candidatus Paceibacterota bacterium]